MKNNKGITMISVTLYIIITLVVIMTLGTLMANFSSEVNQLSTDSTYDVEFAKFNMYILDELQRTDNIVTYPTKDITDADYVGFSNGDSFSFNSTNQTLNMNTDITISENITDAKFNISEKNEYFILTINLTVAGTSKQTDYISQKANHVPGITYTYNTLYTDFEQKKVTIPAGFTVSKLDKEDDVSEGLVIYSIPEGTTVDWTDETTVKGTYDQFVWIPVDNANEMFICQGRTTEHSDPCNISLDEDEKPICTTPSHATREGFTNPNTLMAGRLYATDVGSTFNANLTNQTYAKNSGLREPDIVTNFDNNATYLSILGTNYEANVPAANKTIYNDFGTSMQADFEDMVESVSRYKGFYVGRYETSSMTAETVTVKAGTTEGINYVNWYNMYAQQKAFASKRSLSASIGSSMIWGCQYDQVMKYVNGKTDGAGATYNVTSSNETRHTGSIANTGNNSNDLVQNIYDLEGNVWEWTTEANSTHSRVGRGRLLRLQPFSILPLQLQSGRQRFWQSVLA